MPTPTQVRLPIDLVLLATVRKSILDQLETDGKVSLKVGVDIPIFPNKWNILILSDASEVRGPVECQCVSFYAPGERQAAAGAVPYVQLSTEIKEPPEDILFNLVNGADPGYN